MRAEQDKALRELQATLAKEKDPMQVYIKCSTLMATLAGQRRWRLLQAQARALEKNPPPSPPTIPISIGEMAAYYVVFTEDAMHEDDAVLRDGEKFLAKYPASTYSTSVKAYMEKIIDPKRRAFEGEQEVAAAVNKLDSNQRADLCQVAAVYKEKEQLREARRLYEACLNGGHTVFTPRQHPHHPDGDRAADGRFRVGAPLHGADGEGGSQDLSRHEGHDDGLARRLMRSPP